MGQQSGQGFRAGRRKQRRQAGQHVAKVTVPSRRVRRPTTAAWLSGSYPTPLETLTSRGDEGKRGLAVHSRGTHFFFGSSRFFSLPRRGSHRPRPSS